MWPVRQGSDKWENRCSQTEGGQPTGLCMCVCVCVRVCTCGSWLGAKVLWSSEVLCGFLG